MKIALYFFFSFFLLYGYFSLDFFQSRISNPFKYEIKVILHEKVQKNRPKSIEKTAPKQIKKQNRANIKPQIKKLIKKKNNGNSSKERVFFDKKPTHTKYINSTFIIEKKSQKIRFKSAKINEREKKKTKKKKVRMSSFFFSHFFHFQKNKQTEAQINYFPTDPSIKKSKSQFPIHNPQKHTKNTQKTTKIRRKSPIFRSKSRPQKRENEAKKKAKKGCFW
jgi:hypothetical protein